MIEPVEVQRFVLASLSAGAVVLFGACYAVFLALSRLNGFTPAAPPLQPFLCGARRLRGVAGLVPAPRRRLAGTGGPAAGRLFRGAALHLAVVRGHPRCR